LFQYVLQFYHNGSAYISIYLVLLFYHKSDKNWTKAFLTQNLLNGVEY